MNSKHAYDMLMQDLKAQVANAEADRDAKAETKAKKLQAKADAQGDLKDTTTTMEADKKYLADLTATCEQKASDFESRQQLRADEIVAIEKAIELSPVAPSQAMLTSTCPPCCRSRPPSRSSCPPPPHRFRAALHSTCKHRPRS